MKVRQLKTLLENMPNESNVYIDLDTFSDESKYEAVVSVNKELLPWDQTDEINIAALIIKGK